MIVLSFYVSSLSLSLSLFVLVFFVLDSSPIVDVCFVAEDVFVSLMCCFLAAQISLFFVCLSEEEKSPFLIFLIFLFFCEFSFCTSSQQKQL